MRWFEVDACFQSLDGYLWVDDWMSDEVEKILVEGDFSSDPSGHFRMICSND